MIIFAKSVKLSQRATSELVSHELVLANGPLTIFFCLREIPVQFISNLVEIVRFDELSRMSKMAAMFEDLVADIQRFYPRIYVACHSDHVRAGSTRWRLSSHDSSILAHLDSRVGMSPKTLAGHLGVVASTLSATLNRLVRLGYITSTPVSNDRRQRELRLTELGMEAMSSTSVLDSKRLESLLSRLSASERKDAVRGLSLLAKAASDLKED
jgi:DNA-binding MarR family transcriptional regulator